MTDIFYGDIIWNDKTTAFKTLKNMEDLRELNSKWYRSPQLG